MTVEDPAKPADVRFLHVLQVTDAAAPAAVPAVLLTGSVNGGAVGTAHGGCCWLGSGLSLMPVMFGA
jgi:hypothetical protein